MTKEQVFAFIKKQKTALISSVDAKGFPNTKAMLALQKIDGNDFYFSTNASSRRAAQYGANEKACIYFYKRGWFRYMGVMLVGTMQVITEQSVKDEIWRAGDTMYQKGWEIPLFSFCERLLGAAHILSHEKAAEGTGRRFSRKSTLFNL